MHSISHAEGLRIQQDHVLSSNRPALQTVLAQPTSGISHVPLQARLSLEFADDAGTTRLVGREHFGPLLVQKPLYPEGREVCQVVIIHPPGGVVGGDELEIVAKVGTSANAQITTPGAAKWYKANGHVSHQNIRLDVGAGGSLEWVPQETIFFDNAHVELDHCVLLEKDASYISCEILCFGRTAFGESFSGGQIRQRTRIHRDGKLVWFEQLRLLGGSPAMKASLILADSTVCATLIAVGKAVPGALLHEAREGAGAIANGAGCFGVSQSKQIVVARYLGDSSETARRLMLHVWELLRPAMLGRQLAVPRLWNT